MKRTILTAALILALACGADAVGEMMDVPDAGAQGGTGGNGDQSEFHDFACPSNGWVLTDVDQVDPGKAIIRYSFPDPWLNSGKTVDTQQYAWWSIEGKILVQCSADRPFSLEIRP